MLFDVAVLPRMDSDSDIDDPGFNEGAIDAYNRECEELGYDPVDRMFWEEQEEIRRHAQRVRRAYFELNAAPRVVCRGTKRRRIDGPSCRAETALPSLGVGPLAAAFAFLHPVELGRMEMTAKIVRKPVDAVWRSIFDERVRGCRRSYPSSGEYSTKECRRAVVLEECWLTFRSDLGKLSHMAGCSPFRPPHQFRSGSLSDLLLKRFSSSGSNVRIRQSPSLRNASAGRSIGMVPALPGPASPMPPVQGIRSCIGLYGFGHGQHWYRDGR